MKPIKISEIRKGDWISTEPIFNVFSYINYTLFYSNRIAEVININGTQIKIKCWKVEGGEVIGEGVGISKEEIVFLLNKKEIMDFKKKIILNKLN